MVANELGPLVPLAGLGGGVRRVREGTGQDHVLCVQGEKMVHVYSTGLGSLQHTWYADTGTSIQDVAPALASESDVVILVNKRDIVLADRDKNKMEDCDRVRLEEDATEILTLGGSNYIVFSNGGVEDLQLILKRSEAVKTAGMLGEEETILESQLRCEASGQISVSHLVSRDHGLISVTGRLVLDVTSGTHTVEEVVRKDVISDIRQLKCFTLDRKSNVIMVTSGDTLQLFNSYTGSLEDLANVPAGSKHLAIADIGGDQLAVMGTLTEGGFLHTFSRAFNCVIASCNMKTTAHKGQGLYYLQDRLVITGTNRVMTTSLAAHSLDTLMGRMADSTTKVTPDLSDSFLSMEDMPEHVIIDCILLLLQSQIDQERRLAVLGTLVRKDISDSVMNQQVRERISLEQAVKLLELLELLLRQEDCETEERAVEWVNMVVTCHYLQIVLSQDSMLESVRTNLQETVTRIKARIKVLTECRATLHNLLNTKAPPVQSSNQIYSIEVLQI